MHEIRGGSVAAEAPHLEGSKAARPKWRKLHVTPFERDEIIHSLKLVKFKEVSRDSGALFYTWY